MKIGIDGRAAKWYRGTGIGTYTYQLINNLSIVDSSNQYLILLPQNTDLVLKDNFTIECLKESSNNHFWDDVKTPNLLKNNKMDLYHVPQKEVLCTSAIRMQLQLHADSDVFPDICHKSRRHIQSCGILHQKRLQA